jgi:hypothetical protein
MRKTLATPVTSVRSTYWRLRFITFLLVNFGF